MSKAHVLVVDDQDSIRHFVSKAFESEGYAVQTTGSVKETREAIGGHWGTIGREAGGSVAGSGRKAGWGRSRCLTGPHRRLRPRRGERSWPGGPSGPG